MNKSDSSRIADELASPNPYPIRPSADDIFANCVALLERGVLIGSRFSVGPYTTAVPSHHTWAVLNRRGTPLFLAHDSFEAVVWFTLVDSDPDGWEPDEPILLSSDAEEAQLAFEQRCTFDLGLAYARTRQGGR